MSIAKVIEISCLSKRGFEDAIQSGIKRVSKTVRNVTGAWVKEQQVTVENGRITSYKVNVLITFVVGDDEIREESGTRTAKKAGGSRKR